MDQFNLFQALYMSFYSQKLYRDVALRWGGKTFLYLLMLLTLSFIVFTYQVQKNISIGYQVMSDKVVKQIPVLTIKNGILSTPEARPYYILDADDKSNIAVIDTTERFTTLKEANTSVLITKTQIISEAKKDEMRINTFPASLNMVINADLINSYIKDWVGYLWIVMFVVFVLAAFVYRVIESLLYAIIGKIFSSICKVDLNYMQIVQIIMVALTPVIVLATVIDMFQYFIPRQFALYFVVAMIYMFYGILANRKSS